MLTICLTTLREKPRFELLVDSLWEEAQRYPSISWEFLCVDGQLWYMSDRLEQLKKAVDGRFPYRHLEPKPTVWQGPHRIPHKDYWDACSARNTAFCYADGDYVIFLDDCLEVTPDWLAYMDDAAAREIALAGPFLDDGHTVAECDHRVIDIHAVTPKACSPSWMYGMNMGVPLEAALAVNGYDETYSGQAGVEDGDFGVRVSRGGCDVWFDPRALVVVHKETHQDVCRPEPKKLKLRDDKEHFANEFLVQRLMDDTHRFWTIDRRYNLAVLRDGFRTTGAFPVPSAPERDWRDGQPLKDM